jgi:hypothetical protein
MASSFLSDAARASTGTILSFAPPSVEQNR